MIAFLQRSRVFFLQLTLSAVAFCFAGVAFLWQPVKAAIPGAAGDGYVSPTFGNYGASLRIDVPDYYDLEPDLRLVYNSGGDNNMFGMGWSLSGMSLFERTGSGGGAPRYDDSDEFSFDGGKLLESTSLGGTHVTQHQSYLRIRRDLSNDLWHVWEKDGTQKIFAPLYVTTSGTFRWALSTVEDTNGNTVTYTYWTDPGQNSYPESISYNGYSIKFWRESRPDPISFTDGINVGRSNYRLKTIEVKAGANRIRAYKLSYATSTNSGRSLLTGVQEYGTDALLDASGTVTGGTALPANLMGYSNPSTNLFPSDLREDSVISNWDTTWRYQLADVDGDGFQDSVTFYKNANDGNAHAWVRLGDGTGGFSASAQDSVISNWNTTWHYLLVDVNGDGMQDSVTFYKKASDGNAHAWVRLATGAGKFSTAAIDSVISNWDSTWKYQLADVDGDGNLDAVVIYKNANDGNAHAWVRLGDGTGRFSTSAVDSVIANWNTTWIYLLADINGDGKQDSITFYKNANDGKAHAWVRHATGTGGFSTTAFDTAISTWNTTFTYTVSDVNGDGKQDAVVIYKNAEDGLAHVWVKLSNGKAFNTSAFDDTAIGTFDTDFQYQLADINGDGIQDIVDIYQKASDGLAHAWIKFGTPNGFNSWGIDTAIGTWNSSFKYLLSDVNNDGRTDIVDIYKKASDGVAHAWVKLSQSSDTIVPDRMISMTNGAGGTTRISYVPSSVWQSQYTTRGGTTPTVSQVTVDDGRGNSGINTFSYSDAKYSVADRAFFGFRYHKAVINDRGTFVETYSRQTVQSIGQADAVYVKNNLGNIYSSSVYTYSESGDGVATPRKSLVTSVTESEYNLASNGRQNRTSFSYDSYGNQTQIIDEGDVSISGDEFVKVVEYNYNTAAYIVDAVMSERRYSGTNPISGYKTAESLYYYDGATILSTMPVKGLLTRSDVWDDTTGGYVSASGTFDSYGNQVSTTNTRGFTETTTYDPVYHQYPVSTTNALNHTSTMTWDYAKGSMLTATGPNGDTTSFSYDTLGRSIGVTDSQGNTVTTQYLNLGDPNNQRVRKTIPDGSADGLWSETYSDGLGRVYKTIKEGPVAGITYIEEAVYNDADPKPYKVSLPYRSGHTPVWETYEYDGIGRVVKTTHADNSFLTVSYLMDGNNKPYTVTIDEMGHERSTWLDTDSNLTRVREKNGSIYHDTYRTYDSVGRLIQVKDSANNISSYTYNSLGHAISSTDMDLGTVTAVFDAGGLPVSQTDAKGQTLTATYDALGRVTSKTAGGETTYWYYDESGYGASIGKLTRVVYPGGSESYTYDDQGRVISATKTIGAVSKTMSNAYDSLGLLRSITYPDGEVVSYEYAADGNLYSVSGYVDSIAYGASGQMTQIVYANGTVSNYDYDPNRLWLKSAEVKLGATPLYTASYTYNPLQMVTSMTQGTPNAQTTYYTYDDLNRLTGVNGAQNQSFAYDSIGNMTYNSLVGTYTYGDAAHVHAVTAAGPDSYAYDANGNTLSGGGRTYTWDAQDRLTSVTQDGTATSFTYGSGNDRIKKTNGANTTLYFSPLLEQYNGSPVQYYYAGPILVAKKDSSGTKTWYHSDRLGSVRLMTNSSGAEVRDYNYLAFGTESSSTGTANNERGFTGQILDRETGLMYYNARYYNPKLARFVSADTAIADLDDPQDLNAYSYCVNNPINNTDPTGHKWVLAGYQNVTTYTNKTVTTYVKRMVSQVVRWTQTFFYWQQISPSFTVKWWWFGWHTRTVPAVYIYVPNVVAMFKTVWKEVTDTVRKVIRVAHVVRKAIYKEVADAAKKVAKAASSTWKAVKESKAGKWVAKAAVATGKWVWENKGTIALVVAVVALTVVTGGSGALFAGAIGARLIGGGVNAGAAIAFGIMNGDSPGKIAFDAVSQGALGFASVGAGQVIGRYTHAAKHAASGGLGSKTSKAANFAGNMAFSFVKDTANNMAGGKSLGESLKAAGQGAILGSVLTGGIVASPGGFNNKIAVGVAGVVGNVGGQFFRQ